MPDLLNNDDMNYAKRLLEESGPTAMYDYLSSKGYEYATLANGVAKGNSLAGATARQILGYTLSVN